MSEQEWLCTLCAIRRAVSFCICTGAEQFLCDSCIPSHFARTKPHAVLPVSAYGQHRIPGYFDRFQVRSSNYRVRKIQLLKNLEVVDSCISTFSSVVEKVIEAVRDYSDSVMSQLASIRRELQGNIEQTIADVERTMLEDAPTMVHSWAKMMREPSCDLRTFRYFTYKIDPAGILKDLQSLCEFSIEKPKNENYRLPGLHDDLLRIYDIEKSVIGSYTLSRPFSNGTSLCFISDNALLLLARGPATNAFIVQLPNTEVQEIISMRSPHNLPGLIRVEEFVYVFGGECPHCEKYGIMGRFWTKLPKMTSSASGFTPCLYDKDIYLVKSKGPIDIFNILSQAIRSVNVNMGGLSDNSVSARVNDEIVIITCDQQIGRWKLGTMTVSVAKYELQGERPNCQSPPVVVGKKVYFTRWTTGNLNVFSLDSCVLTSATSS